jgi:hypothetical protein
MGFWEFFWLMIYFFFLFIWIWLLISIFGDIFRNKDMNGFSKAIWVVFVIVLPLIGVLVYLIAHGGGMAERQLQQAAAMEQAQRAYIQEAAGGSSAADEIAKLNELKNAGAITQEEFDAAKAKALA